MTHRSLLGWLYRLMFLAAILIALVLFLVLPVAGSFLITNNHFHFPEQSGERMRATAATGCCCLIYAIMAKADEPTPRSAFLRAVMYAPRQVLSKARLLSGSRSYGEYRWVRQARFSPQSNARGSRRLFPTARSCRFERPWTTISD